MSEKRTNDERFYVALCPECERPVMVATARAATDRDTAKDIAAALRDGCSIVRWKHEEWLERTDKAKGGGFGHKEACEFGLPKSKRRKVTTQASLLANAAAG